MSKSRGPVRKLMDKNKSNASTAANGDFKRWSDASVGTMESDGRWYDGCDFDRKRLQAWRDDRDNGIARPKPIVYSRNAPTGDLHATIPEGEAIPICRRDGGDIKFRERNEALELQAIYNKYVAVYDKVSTTRRRTRSFRRPATVMVELNRYVAVRSRRGDGGKA